MSAGAAPAGEGTTAAPAQPAAGRGRVAWVDDARGVGIVLVVLGHTWRGLREDGLLAGGPLYDLADRSVYSFHMPLFFVLSGLFLGRSATRAPSAWAFLAEKLRTIAYPYVVWTLLQGGLKVALSRHDADPLTLPTLLHDLVLRPYAQFWFLYVLMILQLAAYPLIRAGLGRWPIFGVAVACGVLARTGGLRLPGAAIMAMAWAPWLALGHLLGPVLSSLPATRRPWASGASGLLCWSLVAGGVHLGLDLGPGAPLLTAAGVAGAALLAMGLAASGRSRAVGWLGAESLPIYAAHVLAAAACRLGLVKALHVHSPWVHMAAGVAAGLAVPPLLDRGARLLGFPYLFTLKAG